VAFKKTYSAFAEKYNISKLDYVTVDNPFAGRVICGECGCKFGRKVWNSTDERLRRVIWRCNRKYEVKGKKSCENKHLNDRVLYQAFINTFNTLVENKNYFMEKWAKGLQSENVLVRYKAKQFIRIIENAETIKEFDIDIYFKIIEKMIVFEGNKIIVTLLDGTEIECGIE
jgi:site-specific DNA recombinase